MDETELPQQGKVQKFIKEARRVLHLLKKPNQQEYVSVLKVTGLGVAVIGLVGFIIFLFKQWFF